MKRPRLIDLWDSPWLVGDPSVTGRRLMRRVRLMTIVAVLIANVIGAAVVIAFALLALPKPEEGLSLRTSLMNVGFAAAYLVVALIVGVAWGKRRIEGGRHGIRSWLVEERMPEPSEQRRALRAPFRIMLVQATLWGIATIGFTLLNATVDGLLALGVGLTVALGGLTTSAAAYLLSELSLRPVAARAMAGGPPSRRVSGVATRWLLAWALGTGVPLVGLVLVGIVALTPVEISKDTLAVTTIALGGIGLVFGAWVSLLAAYATAHPVGALRRGLARVREGDFDGELPVWDATEIGLLQAGFNDMVSGLRERERIRDVFGRQVGEDVARRALDQDISLGGETREVAVLFVDVVGSTELAAHRPPEEVVELLNRFFAEVVDVVEHHGGWINKFQGDAALAIFGAPVPMEDPAGCCLAAARELGRRLVDRVPDLEASVGVAYGEVVAGHVGAERRFEYTVIGDPVNEAARLTELAKRHPGRVLASEAALRAARGGEEREWSLGEEITLRGRAQPTRLAVPA